MRDKILVATRNKGKLSEIRDILRDFGWMFVMPADVGIDDSFDIEETGTTFGENALLKAEGFARVAGMPVLADDSGLIVDALGGRPGVFSKRYGASDEKRIERLLEEMKDVPQLARTARFVSVIALYYPDKSRQTMTATGQVEGFITTKRIGSLGFGYDPIFLSTELGLTFAQAGRRMKGTVSHRSRALQRLHELIISEGI